MFQRRSIAAALCGALGAIIVFGAAAPVAADSIRQDGWEPGSAYNQLYNPNETDHFRANVVKVTEVVPMPGMSAGVAIIVTEAPDEEPIEVHVCPTWYMDAGGIGLKRGDRIKIRGVWAEINGKDVFLASKIKKGDYFTLKVRLTKDGKPFWALSEEELARERAVVGSQ